MTPVVLSNIKKNNNQWGRGFKAVPWGMQTLNYISSKLRELKVWQIERIQIFFVSRHDKRG